METLQIIPLVMVAVGAIKDFVPKKYVSVIAVLLGIGFAMLFEADLSQVINGILAGIGSVGAYGISKGMKTKTPIEEMAEQL